MSRNYDNTGESQGGSSYIFLKLNGKDGKIYAHIGKDKRELPGFTGYLEGFKLYEDPGNAEFQIRPHKGITIFLSGKNPANPGEIVQFKLDQGLDNVSIAPTLVNALLGAEAELSKDTLLYFSVWLKDGKHARLTMNIDGQRPKNKFQYSDAEKWFVGVPRPKDVPDPINGGTAKSWLEVKAFWAEQAEQFVHRVSSRFGQVQPISDIPDIDDTPDDLPDYGPIEGDLPAFEPEQEMPAFEPEPPPAATGKKLAANEFAAKMKQVQALKSEAHLVTAYNNLLGSGADAQQLKYAKGVFVQTATLLGFKITFADTGATIDEGDDLPF